MVPSTSIAHVSTALRAIANLSQLPWDMAESVGVEPTLVLPRLRFSKPTHYRSVNSPCGPLVGGRTQNAKLEVWCDKSISLQGGLLKIEEKRNECILYIPDKKK